MATKTIYRSIYDKPPSEWQTVTVHAFQPHEETEYPGLVVDTFSRDHLNFMMVYTQYAKGSDNEWTNPIDTNNVITWFPWLSTSRINDMPDDYELIVKYTLLHNDCDNHMLDINYMEPDDLYERDTSDQNNVEFDSSGCFADPSIITVEI